MHPPSPETCLPATDSRAFTLSVFLTLGTLCSYLPQHIRIVWHRKSTGLNPLFLLLGATSSASSLLNIVALSWYAVRCCSYLTSRQCFEGTLGITQVAVQWLCFNVVFLLYLVYYPSDKRWVSWIPGSVPEARPSKLWRNVKRAFRPANYAGNDEPSSPESDASFDFRNVSYAAITSRRSIQPAETAASPEWRMSTNYAVLTGLHLAVCGFVTLLLLLLLPKASNPPVHPDPDPLPGPHQESHDVRLVRLWATFLGLLSTLLALFQYIPQIIETWQSKIVGSLSIPMMLIQTPGSALFVYSLIIRPGVNWTAWAVYMITGILQGILLVICIAFTIRLRRAGLDAWGKPLNRDSTAFEEDEHRPLLH